MRDCIQYDGFMISYIDEREPNPFDNIMLALGMIKSDNANRPETALIVDNETKRFGRCFYILYGDWRGEYKAIAHKGLDACIAFFADHLEHIGDTSDISSKDGATH